MRSSADFECKTRVNIRKMFLKMSKDVTKIRFSYIYWPLEWTKNWNAHPCWKKEWEELLEYGVAEEGQIEFRSEWAEYCPRLFTRSVKPVSSTSISANKSHFLNVLLGSNHLCWRRLGQTYKMKGVTLYLGQCLCEVLESKEF